MKSKLHAEALVIGAGPSGSALAIWLARQGWDCILVDRARFPRRKPCAGCFSPRCFPYLARLGLDEAVRGGQQIRFIDLQAPQSSVRFDTAKNPLGSSYYVFPREVFDRILVEKARSCSVRLMEGTPIESLLMENGRVAGASGNGLEIRANVTVVATGAFSRFLPPDQRHEIRTYQSLVGWFEGFSPLDPSVTDSFTAPWLMGSGWIFPESDQRANVGIMVHADLLRTSQKNLRDLFRAYCEIPFTRKRLNGAKQVGRLWGNPIRYTLHPRGICGDGFLMVGEACLLTQPLTGEGISQAFRSADLAAEVLAGARSAGCYTREALEPYDLGIRRLFRKNFWKGGFLRRWLDRPFPLHMAISLARGNAGWRQVLEKRLHRIVL